MNHPQSRSRQPPAKVKQPKVKQPKNKNQSTVLPNSQRTPTPTQVPTPTTLAQTPPPETDSRLYIAGAGALIIAYYIFTKN